MSGVDHDSGPGPGDVRPRLDRAPGERYARTDGASSAPAGDPERDGRPPRPVRPLLAAAAIAVGGSAVFFVLGLVAIGPGTLAAAVAIGWAVGLALATGGGTERGRGRRSRMALAAGLAAASVVLGLIAGWAWARVEGGVLPPLEYLDQRYGAVAWLDVLVAAAAGAWRAR